MTKISTTNPTTAGNWTRTSSALSHIALSSPTLAQQHPVQDEHQVQRRKRADPETGQPEDDADEWGNHHCQDQHQ